LLKQSDLGCLTHASYIGADAATGTAVIVASQPDIDQYLANVQTHDVFPIHLHADFLAGHLERHERVGGTVCLGGQTQAEYAFTPFRDGETQPVEFPNKGDGHLYGNSMIFPHPVPVRAG
jgi:hypothetical protein